MNPIEEEEYGKALEWIHGTMRFGSKPGLDRIRHLLSLLGNPERDQEYIHVAGTNGKGSVTAMVASALSACGYRTGMYISPYLEDFRERIVLDGKKIPKSDLAALIGELRPAVEQMISSGLEHPTEFEIDTALAFLYYSRQGCDYVSLEVGLGGRFDATNVIVPAVSTITTISLDHTAILGDTLGQIAFEKAGIVKEGIPVITGVAEEEPLSAIETRAKELGAPLYLVARSPKAQVTWEEVSYSMEGQVINVYGPNFEYKDLRIPLLGRHQQQNAAMAVASLELAKLDRSPGGGAPDRDAIARGIASTRWPGRLEILSRNPAVILDGAHNPGGARALFEAMNLIPRKRLICVMGILADKSYGGVASIIAPSCDEVIVTKPDVPRGLDPRVLAEEVGKYVEKVRVEPDIGKALDAALAKVTPEDVMLCCGSLYLVGSARTYLRQRLGMTRDDFE